MTINKRLQALKDIAPTLLKHQVADIEAPMKLKVCWYTKNLVLYNFGRSCV